MKTRKSPLDKCTITTAYIVIDGDGTSTRTSYHHTGTSFLVPGGVRDVQADGTEKKRESGKDETRKRS